MSEWNVENMVEIKLKQPDDFLKVRETLSRIGIASKKDKKLYQSCHILHKQGRYFIVHFKELFGLDGKKNRCIIYPSWYIHGAYMQDHTQWVDNWRYTQVYFMKLHKERITL